MSSIFSDTQDTIVENRWETTMGDHNENLTLDELLENILNISNDNERKFVDINIFSFNSY